MCELPKGQLPTTVTYRFKAKTSKSPVKDILVYFTDEKQSRSLAYIAVRHSHFLQTSHFALGKKMKKIFYLVLTHMMLSANIVDIFILDKCILYGASRKFSLCYSIN